MEGFCSSLISWYKFWIEYSASASFHNCELFKSFAWSFTSRENGNSHLIANLFWFLELSIFSLGIDFFWSKIWMDRGVGILTGLFGIEGVFTERGVWEWLCFVLGIDSGFEDVFSALIKGDGVGFASFVVVGIARFWDEFVGCKDW